MPELYTNDPGTTLNGTIGSGDSSLTVASATGFPGSGNFRIRIDNELMLVTAVAGNVFTVTRGIEGTSAAGHTDGADVNHYLTSGALDAIRSDSAKTGVAASRPSTPKAGDIYVATDSGVLSVYNGSTWVEFSGLTAV